MDLFVKGKVVNVLLQYDYVTPCLNQAKEEASHEAKWALHEREGYIYDGGDNTLRGYRSFKRCGTLKHVYNTKHHTGRVTFPHCKKGDTFTLQEQKIQPLIGRI
jgi:hypothetical protein